MKVLFAVNNENISESIVKRYQQEYKEIISAKNVYYFNAIIKELQKDKTYDRIVISEDLEPFSNNNYDAIDKFVFDKMDNISDEGTNQSGNDIPVILICTDRREKGEPILVKLFGIGVYNALLGKDRSITTVCELLNRPRTKKEAKVYYRIDSDDVDYKVENDGEVSEVEIQNILNYYKKLGRNEEKFSEAFEHISNQYTDSQLRVIAKCLPLNIRAVLEANCLKYQEVVSFGSMPSAQTQGTNYNDYQGNSKAGRKAMKQQKYNQMRNEEANAKLDIIEKNLTQNRMTEPVIIPSGINTNNVRRIDENAPVVKQPVQPMQQVQQVQQVCPVQPEPMIQQPMNVQNLETVTPNTQVNVQTNTEEMVKNENPVLEDSFEDILPGVEPQNAINNVSTNVEPVIEGFEDINPTPKVEERTVLPGVEEMSEPAPAMPMVQEEQPRRRGRPRKVRPEGMPEPVVTTEKRGRGRPRKIQPEVAPVVTESENVNTNIIEENGVNPEPTVNASPVNLFELSEDDVSPVVEENNKASEYSEMILPGLDDESIYIQEEENNSAPILPQTKETQYQMPEAPELPQTMETEPMVDDAPNLSGLYDDMATMNTMNNPEVNDESMYSMPETNNMMENNSFEKEPISMPGFEQPQTTQAVQNAGKYDLSSTDLSNLITRDKKVVAFVGTSKNGTSFLVNNLAELLSQKGIKTAVLDLTQNKNAYYIYTQNEESLRNAAYKSIGNLINGSPNGISINKNLTVFTSLPGEGEDTNNYINILETLIKNYSLVLLDCDFETNYGYFKEAQEIYLVQSLDVLTIQPLTAFLRDLKAKNVLNPEKIRIALNKLVRVRSLTEKTIIGGMAYYNDPAMSFMTELFNKDLVPYCAIPFEEQTYAKYLEGLVNCKITLNGYSKNFMAALTKLSNMVYPLIGNGGALTQNVGYNNYSANNNFPNSMNDTLNKMKNNY